MRRTATIRILLLTFLVGLCFPAIGSAQAETEPPAGLLWNRTGLPAVFPLQIKTDAGFDYLLTLRDAETDTPALGAFIKGGEYFQVLVPPGLFALEFAAGSEWQNDTVLFGKGDRTRRFNLSAPLEFAVRGVAVKAGHLVDLTQIDLSPDAPRTGERAVVTPNDICQTFASETAPRGAGTTVARGSDPQVPSQLAEPNVLSALPRRSPDFDASTLEKTYRNPADFPTYMRQGYRSETSRQEPQTDRFDRLQVRNIPCEPR